MQKLGKNLETKLEEIILKKELDTLEAEPQATRILTKRALRLMDVTYDAAIIPSAARM